MIVGELYFIYLTKKKSVKLHWVNIWRENLRIQKLVIVLNQSVIVFKSITLNSSINNDNSLVSLSSEFRSQLSINAVFI